MVWLIWLLVLGVIMSTHRECAQLISTVAVVLVVYASSIVPCTSQTSDDVVISKSGWNQLQSAIYSVVDVISPIGSAPTPPQVAPSTSPTLAQATPSTPGSRLEAFADASEAEALIFDSKTSPKKLEGKWRAGWKHDIVGIQEHGQVEDGAYYHEGNLRLQPQPDGTFKLLIDSEPLCHYNIALSPDRKKMVWVPIKDIAPKKIDGGSFTCRPATDFYRILECCGERDRECCGERDRECCGERHRDCCVERHRDCCVERVRREHVVRRRYPPCDYCRWEEWDPYD
jgi:hypothetical protein